MSMQSIRGDRRIPWFTTYILGIVGLVLAGVAQADPPSRVARVGYVNGMVSFSPAGENDWVEATLNRPLITGDRLWADDRARAELQIGVAVLRLGSRTSVTLLNLDDRVAQFQLTQGTLSVRVRRLDPDQVVEIDTPNLAYVIRQPGQYRIAVDAEGDATEVWATNGRAQVYAANSSYAVETGRAYRFYGNDLRDYEVVGLPRADELDRWARDRDNRYDSSISARYVSRDVIGYQDLDSYGTWQSVPEYGNVWMPTRVSSGWAPYRDGHWAWVDPWGWTWVDDAPWGFAVSHYGRWADIRGRWGWIPGPISARAVYAPALVAFVGGGNFGVSISSGNGGAVGWFPLGPRDVYRPAYTVSHRYFTNVNISNTVINNTNITNVYNNVNITNIQYANQRVPGAVVAVPAAAFAQSQPVAQVAMRVSSDAVFRAPVTTVAAIAPGQASVRGAAQERQSPPQMADRPVIVQSVPPPAPVGFAAKERVLTTHPGKPIDAPILAGLRPVVPASNVQVVVPSANANPVAPPPRPPQGNPRERGDGSNSGDRGNRGNGAEPRANEQRNSPQGQLPFVSPGAPSGFAAPVAPAPPRAPNQQPSGATTQEPGNTPSPRGQPRSPQDAPRDAARDVPRDPATNARPNRPAQTEPGNRVEQTDPRDRRPNRPDERAQTNAPAPVIAPAPTAAPPGPRSTPDAEVQRQRARPESPAIAAPAPPAPPGSSVPARRPPEADRGNTEKSPGPPPKQEKRKKDEQPDVDKKGDKKDEESDKDEADKKKKR